MAQPSPPIEGVAPRPTVCIVTPVYNEAAGLPAYEQALGSELFTSDEFEFRIVFVDDGSTDESWSTIREICARDQRFTGIRLSRNYGAHIAISAGLAHAQGDAVAVLACDLQDPPQTLLAMARAWRSGARIVWGKRRTRRDGRWRTWASRVFMRMLRRHAMPRGSLFTTGSFLLIDRSVADCFNQFQEHNRITFALVAWTGFDQAVVEYDRQARSSGTSGWRFGQLVKVMYDAFIGFSLLPIRLMTLLGLGVSAITLLLMVYLVVTWITGDPRPGWTSQMFIVSVFFGVQFLLLGVMGEYLYRIYAEVVRRPLYFVSDKTARTAGSPDG